MIEQELEQLGLTSGEARVYNSLVKIGESTVGPISKESKVAYSKIYDVLERLIEKGLASYIIKEKTKYFQAAPPQRLFDYIEKRQQELEESKKLAKQVVQKLSKTDEDEKETSKVFIGHKGILTAYEIMLKEAQEGEIIKYFYQHRKEYDKLVYEFLIERPQFDALIKKHYQERKISWNGVYHGKGSTPKNEYMILRKSKTELPGNIDTTEKYVFITTWAEKPKGTLIKSKELAKNFREYFDFIWDLSKNNKNV